MAQPRNRTYFLDDDEETGFGVAEITQKAIIDTQERMGVMLDVMPMGFLFHTVQGILFANQEACGMLQVSKTAAVGHHLLDFVAESEFEAVREQLDNSFYNEDSMHKLETRLSRPDGTEVNIRLLSCRLPWQGTPVLQVLLQDVTDLKLTEQKLRRLATIDDLTGAYNRRHVFDEAAMHLARGDIELSIIMLDIDHFKRINDTYGHAVGDLALRRMTQVCNDVLAAAGKSDETFARVGGEEFLVLLPATSEAEAQRLAEDLRLAVNATSIELPTISIGITVSLGVCTYRSNDHGFDGLLSRCDVALYRAKDAGRNCVVVG
ncbi:MAG: cyclic-guanylate-specific phosphodiesterase [Hyphomicrobiales bacterium]|nr:cyclic-guanylate-specific phosphodiesterase [Hyphomicrobiales bacterium]